MHTRTPVRRLTLLLLLSVALGATACIEEDKTDCRTHADCRGVRQCDDGVCFTPAEYDGDRFAPRYADEAPAGLTVLPLTPEDGRAVRGRLDALDADADYQVIRLHLLLEDEVRVRPSFKVPSPDIFRHLAALESGVEVSVVAAADDPSARELEVEGGL